MNCLSKSKSRKRLLNPNKISIFIPEELFEIKLKIEEEFQGAELIVERYKELTKPIAPENSIRRVSRMDVINNKSVNDATLVKATTKKKIWK